DLIDIVNEIDYGLTSGLHSLDRDNMDRWLQQIQAGNLYINRGITGAMVRRQSFGGWKKSAIGTGSKVGAPSYLHGLVDWADAPVQTELRTPRGRVASIVAAAQLAGLSDADLTWLQQAVSTDVSAWNDEFGVAKDQSQLGVERNILRYLPTRTHIRIAEDAPLHESVRAIA